MGLAGLRVEKSMGMKNKITHLRIVDGTLSRRAPGVKSRRIVGEGADEIDRRQIDKLGLSKFLQLTTYNKVQ